MLNKQILAVWRSRRSLAMKFRFRWPRRREAAPSSRRRVFVYFALASRTLQWNDEQILFLTPARTLPFEHHVIGRHAARSTYSAFSFDRSFAHDLRRSYLLPTKVESRFISCCCASFKNRSYILMRYCMITALVKLYNLRSTLVC
jgi:hypothetical protein